MPLTDHMEMARPFEDAGFTPPQAHALAGLVGALDRNFNSIGQRLDSLERETRTRFNAVDQRLDGVDARLDGVETRLGSIERELRNLPWKLFTVMLTVAALVIAAQKFL